MSIGKHFATCALYSYCANTLLEKSSGNVVYGIAANKKHQSQGVSAVNMTLVSNPRIGPSQTSSARSGNFMMPKPPPLKSCRRRPYANIPVFDADGGFMFFAAESKARWYVGRELAVWHEAASMPSSNSSIAPAKWLQLTFKPKGEGRRRDEFYRHALMNKCVVCGKDGDSGFYEGAPADQPDAKKSKMDTDSSSAGCGLVRTHVIPSNFRAHFPDSAKSHSNHDIVAMCIPCHCKYNQHATAFAKRLLQEAAVPPLATPPKDWARLKKKANALLRSRDRMPQTAVDNCKKQVLECIHQLTAGCFPAAVLETTASQLDDNNHLCAIVAAVQSAHTAFIAQRDAKAQSRAVVAHHCETKHDLDDFVRRWRELFLERMRPKYLMQGWGHTQDDNRPITFDI